MFTVDEKEQLDLAMQQLTALSGLVQAAITVPVPTADTVIITPKKDEIDLDDLKPTGELNEVAEHIRKNMPISEEEFNSLVEQAQQCIKTDSRLNGFLQNITSAVQQLSKVIFPIIKGAL